jgi:hypothetical protein
MGKNGEKEIIEDRALVEEVIANYFKDINKKPQYIVYLHPGSSCSLISPFR